MSQNYIQNKNTPNVQLNSKILNASTYLASKMPNANNTRYSNPVESLTIDEITYLQEYLQKIKQNKLNHQNRATDFCDPVQREMPLDWREFNKQKQNINTSNPIPGSRGSATTRMGKKTDNYDYHNPYEYGAKQNQLGQLNRPIDNVMYNNNPNMLNEMGLTKDKFSERFPGQIRNINIESSLIQKEPTHFPGQRDITEKENDRFELLPFDPQDPNHIVWPDMPRGGHPTRIDRLEY